MTQVELEHFCARLDEEERNVVENVTGQRV